MKFHGKVYFLALIAVILSSGFFWITSKSRAATSFITATVAVGICGNNIAEFGEDCDGSALDGQTCESRGFDGGTLSCNPGCGFNESECVNLGPDEGSVVFSGKAYPMSVIKILKDGSIAATTAADADGNFETTLTHLIVGSYSFAVYAYDSNGIRSKTITFRSDIAKDEIEEISGIAVPPTLEANKDKVKKGNKIIFSGQSAPGFAIAIDLDSSGQQVSLDAISGSSGFYSYNFDTDDLDPDDYTARSKSAFGGSWISDYGETVPFEVVADPDSESHPRKGPKRADFNDDSRINLIDFSILIHWLRRDNFPDEIDINDDKKVDLVDLSIMMYYWTA